MRHIKTAFILTLALATVATAQEPGRRGGRRGDMPMNQVAARQAIERLIRTQIQPTDQQMKQLQAIDARFEPQRIELNREEMTVRRQLRQAMLDSTNVDEARIGQLLDRMVTFPGRRAAIMEAESKALAGVLTPLQRAKYYAIQEQLRRRIEQGRGGPPPGRKPPG